MEPKKDDASPKRPEDTAETVEELADDMLHLIERVGPIEESLRTLVSAVGELQEAQARGLKSLGLEIEKLKEALFSDRKAFLAVSTLNALLPTLESLEIMQKAPQSGVSDPEGDHVSVLSAMLRNIIKGLGFTAFEAGPGEPFDPASMECLDFSPGEEGKVVRTIRAGYRAGETVVKPCGVVLGREGLVY